MLDLSLFSDHVRTKVEALLERYDREAEEAERRYQQVLAEAAVLKSFNST